jgi:hypothetical protein
MVGLSQRQPKEESEEPCGRYRRASKIKNHPVAKPKELQFIKLLNFMAK